MTPPPSPASVLDPARLRVALAAIEPAAHDHPDRVLIARAPGRVNLIGEHTDYNEGYVLPVAIGLEIRIAFVPTDDRRVELTLEATGDRRRFELDAIGPRTGTWIDYVAGTAWALAAAGIPTRGFRGVLVSTLPTSSGLSSSAALELVAARALLADQADGTDRMRLALIAQRAENEYVGVNCGLMDQFASSVGNAHGALLLDCRSLEYRAVALPLGEYALVVCDSASPRRLGSSQYNERRAQCERAVALLAGRGAPVRALRDVDPAMLASLGDVLDPVSLKRCEHVVREDERVLTTVAALESGDLPTVARDFAASHASLRDLYEVSSPELDALVEIAGSVPGVRAARMTGAGFGGCTINVVERGAVGALREAVASEYRRRTGLVPRILRVEPAAGAGLIDA
jgi:galactokinase